MEFTNSSPPEPFIRLPSPHDNIIITPPRYSDGATVIEMLSRPEVYMNLAGPPFPYTQQCWEEWYPIIAKESADSLAEYYIAEESRKSGIESEKKWVKTAIPVCSIRESNRETGEEKLIGEFSVRYREFLVVTDLEERKKAKEINEGYKAGDPRIEREIGFYLSPSVHGRGIMPLVLKTMMEKFMIPYMNLAQINGSYYITNKASRRVFEKNNFFFWKEVPDLIELSELKTGVKGKKVGVGLMKWERKL